MTDSKLVSLIKLCKQQLAIICPGSVCVQYAKPWLHPDIRSCCGQSAHVLLLTSRHDSTLLRNKMEVLIFVQA